MAKKHALTYGDTVREARVVVGGKYGEAVSRPASNGPLEGGRGGEEQLLGGELASVACGAEDDEIVLSFRRMRGHCGCGVFLCRKGELEKI